MPDATLLPDLAIGYADLDSAGYDSLVTFSNNKAISITGTLVFNDDVSGKRFNPQSNVTLHYNRDIEELKIDERLYSFGITGEMVLTDDQGRFTFLTEDYNFYHLVINIYEQITELGNKFKLEPYIFHITSVEPMSPPDEVNKKLLVRFVDIISYEAMTHQFASLLKFDNTFKECKSYPEAFKRTITYLLELIKENTKGKFEYKKEFKFHDDYDTDDTNLIKITLDRLNETSTLYEVLTELTRDACVAMTPNPSTIADFESIGDVRIPMFCREEMTALVDGYYGKFPTNTDNVIRTDKIGAESLYFYRPFTLRSFYMPFQLASEDGLIFESFNPTPKDSEEKKMSFMMGSSQVPIKGIDTLPSNAATTAHRWKNMIFMACEGGQASSQLVFFNWMYEYFNRAFLDGKLNNSRDKLSNVIPSFYFVEKTMNADGDDFKRFSEMNSNMFPIRTKDGEPTDEILMEIGKTIASLVFLNTCYSFSVPGNILRRPNEIIKMSRGDDDTQNNLSMFTDYAFSEHVYLYTTQISHYWHGLDFDDIIVCNRIYERRSS